MKFRLLWTKWLVVITCDCHTHMNSTTTHLNEVKLLSLTVCPQSYPLLLLQCWCWPRTWCRSRRTNSAIFVFAAFSCFSVLLYGSPLLVKNSKPCSTLVCGVPSGYEGRTKKAEVTMDKSHIKATIPFLEIPCRVINFPRCSTSGWPNEHIPQNSRGGVRVSPWLMRYAPLRSERQYVWTQSTKKYFRQLILNKCL